MLRERRAHHQHHRQKRQRRPGKDLAEGSGGGRQGPADRPAQRTRRHAITEEDLIAARKNRQPEIRHRAAVDSERVTGRTRPRVGPGAPEDAADLGGHCKQDPRLGQRCPCHNRGALSRDTSAGIAIMVGCPSKIRRSIAASMAALAAPFEGAYVIDPSSGRRG
jgi:hypothetical protein